jgi:hypothetical protein
VPLSTSNDILALKHAYEVLQGLKLVHEYGPLRSFLENDAAQRAQTIIAPAVSLVHSTSRRDKDGTYLVDAPSPWHAYFYLRAQQQFCFRGGRPLGEPPSLDGKTLGEHLFFRGQRCASWTFQTSRRRKNQCEQQVEQRAVTAVTEYFRLMFASDQSIASNIGLCFAQHYGIATDLIDISCDADIAVWFATHPSAGTCPNEEGAVVRSVSWAGQEDEAKTLFLLPPPFVRNVYLQRGLFIDASATNGLMLGKIQMQVYFPRDTAGGEFQVIRSGTSVEVWPGLDRSERELVHWAREIALEYQDDEAVRSRVVEDRNANTFPEFWLEKGLYEHDTQLQEWLSLLDWVLPATCVTALPVAGHAPMLYEVSTPKVRALVRANSGFFRAFVSVFEGANFTGFESLERVFLIARAELSK